MKTDFAKRLIEARESLGKTQKAFSELTGIPESTLKKWEGSHREPKVFQMAALVEAGIDLNYLVCGEGKAFSKIALASEPSAVAYRDVSSPINSVLLQEAIDFFYRWLAENKDRVRIDADKHGAVIAIMYRFAAEAGELRREELEQVIVIAA